MAEKPKFMVFRVYFYLKYISNKDDIWLGETLPGVLLEKKEILTFQNKEIYNGCAKMQNYIVAGCIKGVLIIC